MGFCLGSGGNLLWVIVWGLLVICMCSCVGCGNFLWVVFW